MRPRARRAAWLPLLLLRCARGAPEADLVDALPGWDGPLTSKTYAGYIGVGGGGNATRMYEHYLFFQSEGDPAADPLIMWTNGGPGASSFLGAFSELGPYYLSDQSMRTEAYQKTGVPTLYENPYRWSRLGSLLIRNLPPPIGFSYCEPAGPAGDGYSCGPWNDTSVARHSLAFMRGWLEAFPEYKGRDLFLVGESYAGVYVPMLAREILQHGGGLAKQLKGIAVGDGCTNGLGCVASTGPLFSVEFFHGHGQFSDRTYRQIKSLCTESELAHGCRQGEGHGGSGGSPLGSGSCSVSEECARALDRMDEERGYSFDYNLYDECYDFSLAAAAPPRRWHEPFRFSRPAAQRRPGPPRVAAGAAGAAAAAAAAMPAAGAGQAAWHMDGAPCGGTAVLPHWVNHSAVKRALHVPSDAAFFDGDNGVGFTYVGTEPPLQPWYRDIATGSDLRVLIYNGDTDPGLNSFLGENWTAGLGLREIEPWRPWTRDGKIMMGGYVTRYEGDFDYLTIRGSGHMVPEYKPEAAFVFLQHFLQNKEYPRYVRPAADGEGGRGRKTATPGASATAAAAVVV